MEIENLLKTLEARKIRLKRNGDKVIITGPRAALTKELLADLQEKKTALLSILDQKELDIISRIPEASWYKLSHKQKGKCYMFNALGKCKNPALRWEIGGFNQSITLHFNNIDVNAVALAVKYLVQSNEGLRTTFQLIDNEFVQIVNRESDQRYFQHIRLDDIGKDTEALLSEIDARRKESMDFVTGPLFKAYLFEHNGAYALLIVVNHVISDGGAMQALLNELEDYYTSAIQQKELRVKDKLQIKDFAAWESKVYDGPEGKRRSNFWKEKIQSAQTFPLRKYFNRPTSEWTSSYVDTLRNELHASFRDLTEEEILPLIGTYHRGTTYPGSVVGTSLSGEDYTGVCRLAQETASTTFIVLLTSLQILHHELTESPDILIGYESSNRNRKGTEDIIGWVGGTILSRIALITTTSIEDLIKYNHSNETSIYLSSHYPIDRILRDVDISLDALGAFYLNYQQNPNASLKLPAMDESKKDTVESPSYFHVDFLITGFSDGLDIQCRFRKDLFDATFIDQLLKKWNSIVRFITANPTARVEDYLNY